MAQTKFLLLSDCRFGGVHHAKGEEHSFNLDEAAQGRLVAELVASERIALATPEMVKLIGEELRAEKAASAEARKQLVGKA